MQLKKDWHAAREKFGTGVSALRGVCFDKSNNAWRADAKDPATRKQKHIICMNPTKPDAETLCGKAYDRQQLKWRGR